MQYKVSYDDQYYQNMSWIDSNSTTSTKVVNKEHEKFHLNSKLGYFAPINLMMTTVLMIISGSLIVLKIFTVWSSWGQDVHLSQFHDYCTTLDETCTALSETTKM